MRPATPLLLLTLLPLLLTPIRGIAQTQTSPSPTSYLGFDRNDYPGDTQLPAFKRHFDFTGYWLNNPPGATANTWAGKRDILLRNGFGFLVLWNGRLDAEILKARRAGTDPATLGARDAAAALAAATREHFPPGTILFLDQEEGGRLLPEQSAYLLAWTEAIARSGFLPGVYLSGQPVPDGPGRTITTAQDIRTQVAAAPPAQRSPLDRPGRLPARQRLHPPPPSPRRQRHPLRGRLAVCPVPSPPRHHLRLREVLCRGWKLLRSRPPRPLS